MKLIKVSLLILSLCLLGGGVSSQDTKPEKVYSIVKLWKSYDWYVEQQGLWKEEIAKKSKNADGWLSYYTATRMAKIMAPDEEKRNVWIEKMDEVVEEMKKNIKGTYEYYYIQGYHSEHRTGIEYILKAYEMDPTRPDVYDELTTEYELDRDKEKLKEVSKKWRASGDISPTLLLWNYNMLVSTEKNAILITLGDNDTYPSWVLQYADGVRTDVNVLNSSLMLVESYREKLFKELEIPVLEGEFSNAEPIIEHIIKHKGNRPLYFTIAGNHTKIAAIKDKVYNVGLAMRYSENGKNNTSLLINNFENKLMLDHLKCFVYNEQFPSEVKRYDLLYVPGLLMLHEHYLLIDDVQKSAATKATILKIIGGSNQEQTIKEALANQEKKC